MEELGMNASEWVSPIGYLQFMSVTLSVNSFGTVFLMPRNGSGSMNSSSVPLLTSVSAYREVICFPSVYKEYNFKRLICESTTCTTNNILLLMTIDFS